MKGIGEEGFGHGLGFIRWHHSHVLHELASIIVVREQKALFSNLGSEAYIFLV